MAALLRPALDETDQAGEKSRELILQLLEYSPAPFSRKQYAPGHVTSTALILHPSEPRILLVHHRRLDRWLLPGGHVDAEDAELWDTSRREAVEETGVILDISLRPVLAGFDVHGIPSNGREPFHLHHDIIVRWRAASEHLHRSEDETRGVAWCAPEEYDKYLLPSSIRLCAERAERFLWA